MKVIKDGTSEQQKAIEKMKLQAQIKEVAHEVIELPSKGWGYPEASPLSKGVVRLKFPTAYHQSILNSQNLLQKGIVLDEFLKSILMESIDIDDLLLGDKNYLIYASRILTYGPQLDNYEFVCDKFKCGAKFKHTIDLTELNSKQTPKLFQYEKGTVQFEYTLPNQKSLIKFRLLTGHMSNLIEKRVKQSKNKATQLLFTIASRITQYDGQTDYNNILSKVKNMSTRDSKQLRKYINEIEPNINIKKVLTCPECQEEMQVVIGLTIDFFWIKQL